MNENENQNQNRNEGQQVQEPEVHQGVSQEMQARAEDKRLPRVKPATDIVETEDGFYIFMDMPGVSKEELVIDLNEDEIKVSGRTDYPSQDGEKLIHVEFGNGEYYRGFTLSQIVDKGRIKAQLKNGVLELHLPKAEKAQPRKIEIQMG